MYCFMFFLHQKCIDPAQKALLLRGNLNMIDNKIDKELTTHSRRIRIISTILT